MLSLIATEGYKKEMATSGQRVLILGGQWTENLSKKGALSWVFFCLFCFFQLVRVEVTAGPCCLVNESWRLRAEPTIGKG